MKQNSCIVVTGANGLAGSAVVEHFRDREFTSVVPLTRADADLAVAHETMDFFARVRPEYVFHAAATVYGLQGNMDNQYKSLLENTLINTHVINAAHRVGVKKIVAMGTNAAYPGSAKLPYMEEDLYVGRPHHGEFGYGHAKRHMLAMLEVSGLDYAYLVSGNLFGPRDTFDPINGHVLPSLIHKFYEASINNNATVKIWGDGSASRDFLFAPDLADCVSFAMGNPNFIGAVNIGSGQTVPLEYVAKRLCSISGVDYERVVYDLDKPTGRKTCYPDLTKLRNLGWRPKTFFADGLRATYEWYRASREAS